ncbi:hypothetical protein PV783_18045 [Chitinophaga sp. CC14]|uniref:hypothetical protein n=1 Tax=Chitinophaga sp. CC14 TaxID=3029199 RepID=UPI003B7A43FA
MNFNKYIALDKKHVLIFFLASVYALACGQPIKSSSFCGFNYARLLPDKSCISGLDIKAEYSSNIMVSLDFYLKNERVQHDTVVNMSGTDFLISQYKVGTMNLTRVSAILQDTTRTFVFRKDDKAYNLVLVETMLADTCIKVEYVDRGMLVVHDLYGGILRGIKFRYRELIFFSDYFTINFFYNSEGLNYKIHEYHAYLPGYGIFASEIIQQSNNSIYLDLPLIEDRTLFYLHGKLTVPQ